MEIQDIITLAKTELEKAVAEHKKYGYAYAVVHKRGNWDPQLHWGHYVAGYSYQVEKVYRHNGTAKDCSVRISVTDNHENGWNEAIYEDKFKSSLTEKTILKKIQAAVAFIQAQPEKVKDRIHAYAGPIGQVANLVYYGITLDKGVEVLDEKCHITAKLETAMEYDEFLAIYGDRPWEAGRREDSPEKTLARQLSEKTGVKSCYLT